jgi:hypothetical protein
METVVVRVAPRKWIFMRRKENVWRPESRVGFGKS